MGHSDATPVQLLTEATEELKEIHNKIFSISVLQV